MSTGTELLEAVEKNPNDKDAKRAFWDWLQENNLLTPLIPRAIVVPLDKVRVVTSTHPQLGGDVVVDHAGLKTAIYNWLHLGEPLILMGMSVELYQIIEPKDMR